MNVTMLGFGCVLEVRPRRIEDHRGFFSETYNASSLEASGISVNFVQDNHSYSKSAATLRGLHFQTPPRAQDKLVRVVRGEIFDVAVDIRHGSPTFGKWVGLRISAREWNQIFIPKGFAHGMLTMSPDTEVIYKVSDTYSAEHDRSIRFDDPAIGISWPELKQSLEISAKDKNAPLLADIDTGFVYSGGST